MRTINIINIYIKIVRKCDRLRGNYAIAWKKIRSNYAPKSQLGINRGRLAR